MKLKFICFALAAAVLCFASCDRNNAEPPLIDREYLFNRTVLMAGISGNLEDYRVNPDYSVMRAGPLTREDAERMPHYWYMAESEEAVIVFWPENEWDENTLYHLQFITIIKNTENYFLGQFVGMSSEELFRTLGQPDVRNDFTPELARIFYYNADGSEFIAFWLANDIVDRAGWAYSVD